MKTKTAMLLVLLAGTLAWSQQSDQKPAQSDQKPPAPAAQPAPQADQAPQPSLADIARANKARKAKKVYDNEDLPTTGGLAGGSASGLSPASASADTAARPSTPAPAAANADKPDAPKPDAANQGDKEKKSPQADRIAYLEKDMQDMLKQRDLIQGKLDNETSDSQKAVWIELIGHLNEQYQKEQQELDQLKSNPTAPKQP